MERLAGAWVSPDAADNGGDDSGGGDTWHLVGLHSGSMEGEPLLSSVSPQVIGIAGAGLFGALLLLAVTRGLLSLCTPQCTLRRPIGTPHRRFCASVALVGALDAPRFLMMALRGKTLESQGDWVARLCYSLHMLAMWSQVVALSIVAGLFAGVFAVRADATGDDEIIERKEVTCAGAVRGFFAWVASWPKQSVVFTLVNLVLLVVTAILSRELFVSPRGMPINSALQDSILYLPFCCAVAGGLLVTAGGLVLLGMRVRARIGNYNWSLAHRRRVDKLLRRLSMTLSVCTFCYLLRVVALFMLLNWNVRNNKVLSPFIWNIFSYWLPTVVPAALLLLTMRGPNSGRQANRGQPGGYGGTGGAQHHYVSASSSPGARRKGLRSPLIDEESRS